MWALPLAARWAVLKDIPTAGNLATAKVVRMACHLGVMTVVLKGHTTVVKWD
eukprot:gene4201-5359_t